MEEEQKVTHVAGAPNPAKQAVNSDDQAAFSPAYESGDDLNG